MSNTENRAVVLARRPDGNPVPKDFRVEAQPWPELLDGQFRMLKKPGAVRA